METQWTPLQPATALVSTTQSRTWLSLELEPLIPLQKRRRSQAPQRAWENYEEVIHCNLFAKESRLRLLAYVRLYNSSVKPKYPRNPRTNKYPHIQELLLWLETSTTPPTSIKIDREITKESVSIRVNYVNRRHKKHKMQASLFTKEEMRRENAIKDVITAYNQEINWWRENQLSKDTFNIRKDPSGAFITTRQKRDFAECYPVRLSLLLRMPFLTTPVLAPLRTQHTRNSCLAVVQQKTRKHYLVVTFWESRGATSYSP